MTMKNKLSWLQAGKYGLNIATCWALYASCACIHCDVNAETPAQPYIMSKIIIKKLKQISNAKEAL